MCPRRRRTTVTVVTDHTGHPPRTRDREGHASGHTTGSGITQILPWSYSPIRACEVTVHSTTVCSCITRSVSGRSRSARVPVRGFCARGSSALSRFIDAVYIGCRQRSSGNSLPLPVRVRHGAYHRPGWVTAQYARPKNSRTRPCSLEHAVWAWGVVHKH